MRSALLSYELLARIDGGQSPEKLEVMKLSNLEPESAERAASLDAADRSDP